MPRRRSNGNLYPMSAQERRRRATRRGSYKNYAEEFTSIDTLIAHETREVVRLSKEILEGLAQPRTRWERFIQWLRRVFEWIEDQYAQAYFKRGDHYL